MELDTVINQGKRGQAVYVSSVLVSERSKAAKTTSSGKQECRPGEPIGREAKNSMKMYVRAIAGYQKHERKKKGIRLSLHKKSPQSTPPPPNNYNKNTQHSNPSPSPSKHLPSNNQDPHLENHPHDPEAKNNIPVLARRALQQPHERIDAQTGRRVPLAGFDHGPEEL